MPHPAFHGRDDGRRRDAGYAPRRPPASKSICTIWRVVRAADDRGHRRATRRLPSTSASRSCRLHAEDALLAHALLELDERSPDMAVLDQPLAERNARRSCEPDRRRRRCRGRGSAARGRLRPAPRRREIALAHPHAGAVHLDSCEPRVGPCEVEELEDVRRAVEPQARPPGSTGDRRRRLRSARRAARRARRSRRRGPSARGFGGDDGVIAEAAPGRVAGTRARRRNARACRRRGRRRSRRPRAEAIVAAIASSRGRSSSAINAAITSESELDASVFPAAARQSRGGIHRFPLWPSATVRTRPWCSNGCARVRPRRCRRSSE